MNSTLPRFLHVQAPPYGHLSAGNEKAPHAAGLRFVYRGAGARPVFHLRLARFPVVQLLLGLVLADAVGIQILPTSWSRLPAMRSRSSPVSTVLSLCP